MVFVGATVILLGHYAALQGAPPFPQFLAFIAISIAIAARLPAAAKDDRR